MGIRGGKAEILEKRGRNRKMEEKSKPARFKTEACGNHISPTD